MTTWREGLIARIRAMHWMWARGVADLSVAQVNHVERAAVLPIAFTLVHYVRGEDANASRVFDQSGMRWDAHVDRIGFKGEVPVRGSAMALASAVRIGDMDAWRAYQTAVFERTEAMLHALAPHDLEMLMFDGVRPDGLESSFIESLVPSGPLRRGDLAEAWIYQHGIRHIGELEHARALVGLGGLS
ncbi:MAG TPA: hypothetical protein VM070_08375 [Candidatus Saccharimonadales bacterium]|nr:hypothetical protein [Candidatus Saccharimonadales bacterium]